MTLVSSFSISPMIAREIEMLRYKANKPNEQDDNKHNDNNNKTTK